MQRSKTSKIPASKYIPLICTQQKSSAIEKRPFFRYIIGNPEIIILPRIRHHDGE